jgi:hypothetical protein
MTSTRHGAFLHVADRAAEAPATNAADHDHLRACPPRRLDDRLGGVARARRMSSRRRRRSSRLPALAQHADAALREALWYAHEIAATTSAPSTRSATGAIPGSALASAR